MKSTSPILFLFIIACFTSCVNRIAIPEDEDAKLFIDLEMLQGDTKVIADFKTTNNLNGSYPIEYPNNAIIKVEELNPSGNDVFNDIEFEFDEDLKRYVSIGNVDIQFLKSGRGYKMDASIEGAGYEAITSRTVVPHSITIEDFELISEEIVKNQNGDDVWQGVLGLEFQPANVLANNYGHLQIHGFRTIDASEPGEEPNYQYGQEMKFFDLVDVNVGYAAITDLIHKDGFFINFDKLEDNYIEIVIRSNFPITEPNQVTAELMTDLMSVSEEHYKYHISYHNIKQSQGNIFEEDALYISNIEKGFGLFSSCVNTNAQLELRK